MEFQARLKAAIVHLFVTVAIAAAVASIIFNMWFPGVFSDMVGGKKLFLLVLSCDLALGPLVSLVIYNRRKLHTELIRDYIIVGVLQLAALVYGVSVVVGSRPVYIVFVVDRLEVVTASELEDKDLLQSPDERYRARGWTGPKLVSVERPENSEERMAILQSALNGKDIQLMPKYYRPYRTAINDVRKRSLPIADLIARKPMSRRTIESAVQGIDNKKKLRWLPVRHRFGFWVTLIESDSGNPVIYLPIDPY